MRAFIGKLIFEYTRTTSLSSTFSRALMENKTKQTNSVRAIFDVENKLALIRPEALLRAQHQRGHQRRCRM